MFTQSTQDYERIPPTATRTAREQGKARPMGLTDPIFTDDDKAMKWLIEQRWGLNGQTCPSCGDIDHHYWAPSRGLFKCRAKQCGKQFSVFTRTKFHATALKPRQVAQMVFLWQEAAEGISSRELSGLLGRDYRATHLQVMKLREALIQTQERSPLTGVVSVDAAYFQRYVRPPNKGNPTSFRTKARGKEVADETMDEKQHPGSAAVEKPKPKKGGRTDALSAEATTNEVEKYQHNPNMHAVVAFVERLPGGAGIGRIRVAVIRTENQVDILRLTLDYVGESAHVLTDEHGAYTPLIATVAEHTRVSHKSAYVDDDGNHTNHVECFFSEMRRAQAGAFHSMGLGYLLYYATEIAWRLEMRDKPNKVRMDDLAQRALRSGPPVQFADMGNKRPKAGKPRVEKPESMGIAFEVPRHLVKPALPQYRRKKRVSRNGPRPAPDSTPSKT